MEHSEELVLQIQLERKSRSKIYSIWISHI